MVVNSRWNEYSTTDTTDVFTDTGVLDAANSDKFTGTRAVSIGNGGSSFDSVSIIDEKNQLAVRINSEVSPPDITLASGTGLDPRFVALDIQRKVQDSYTTVSVANRDAYKFAQCEFRNGKFHLFSGDIENSVGSTSVAVEAPSAGASRDARSLLEWGAGDELQQPGLDLTNTYIDANAGAITISGTYNGQFDDVFTIIATADDTIDSVTPDIVGSFTGSISAGGTWNGPADDFYDIVVDLTNGSLMNAGTGNVPFIKSWTSDVTSDDNASANVEVLYSDTYYHIGTKGLMVKFSDGAFQDNGLGGNEYHFRVTLHAPDDVDGIGSTSALTPNAKFIVKSLRGKDGGPFDTDSTFQQISGGTKDVGIFLAFASGKTMTAGDAFTVLAKSVSPTSGDVGVTQVNYGNVTVSTESPVKAVNFEIKGGATLLTDLKFGLVSDGTFQHHDQNDSDTDIRFATVGAGLPSAQDDEWPPSQVTATDLNGGNGSPPAKLKAIKTNLNVVNSADLSETVGNTALNSDYIFVGIKVGASETGATTVTYRMFFDFS
jgi:hypothetical protein